jgi:hypothetical protein
MTRTELAAALGHSVSRWPQSSPRRTTHVCQSCEDQARIVERAGDVCWVCLARAELAAMGPVTVPPFDRAGPAQILPALDWRVR